MNKNQSHTALVLEYISLGVEEIKDEKKIELSKKRRGEIISLLKLSHEEILNEAQRVIK